jgi:hypothetical protein
MNGILTRQSIPPIVRDPIFYIVVIGYLCQMALLYLSFSVVPEKYLHASHLVVTMQGNIYILPLYIVLLIGALIASQDNRMRSLIRRYVLSVIIPGLLFTALSIEAGHAFIGAIAIGILTQWAFLIIGTLHVYLKFRWWQTNQNQSTRTSTLPDGPV